MPTHYNFLVKIKDSEIKPEIIRAASHLRAAGKYIEENEPDDEIILEITSQEDYGANPVIKVWSVTDIVKKLENKKRRSLDAGYKTKRTSNSDIYLAPYASSFSDRNTECPKCGSERITTNKKGFSVGKGLLGAALTGGIGLVAGFHGKNDLYFTCLNCGHKW